MVSPLDAEHPERLVGLCRREAPPGQAQRHRDVLARGERRPEVPALEDDRDLARPVLGELLFSEACQRAAERADLAGRRLVEPGGQVEHRALARARGAEDGDRLALLDAVDLEDVMELERSPGDLLTCLGLLVEAPYLHRKLSIISR